MGMSPWRKELLPYPEFVKGKRNSSCISPLPNVCIWGVWEPFGKGSNSNNRLIQFFLNIFLKIIDTALQESAENKTSAYRNTWTQNFPIISEDLWDSLKPIYGFRNPD